MVGKCLFFWYSFPPLFIFWKIDTDYNVILKIFLRCIKWVWKYCTRKYENTLIDFLSQIPGNNVSGASNNVCSSSSTDSSSNCTCPAGFTGTKTTVLYPNCNKL